MDMPLVPPSSWFAELDVEDPILLQDFVRDCLIDYPLQDTGAVMEELQHTLTLSSGSECNSSSTAPADIISSDCAKRLNLNQSPITRPNRPDEILSFGSTNSSSNNNNINNYSNAESPEKSSTKDKCPLKKPKRMAHQCHNHIVAERQRRQNLSQGFIALSALIPGLKKIDKTSVLGEAINHMKQLKERLKILEEENASTADESVVVVKKSRVIAKDVIHSSSGNDKLPEIEARFCNKSVLIKINCAMQKGMLTKIFKELEKVHLSVSTTNAMPFNGTTLDITIVAQMEPEFEMTPGDVMEDLRSIFQ